MPEKSGKDNPVFTNDEIIVVRSGSFISNDDVIVVRSGSILSNGLPVALVVEPPPAYDPALEAKIRSESFLEAQDDASTSDGSSSVSEPDPWDIVPGVDDGPKWSELSASGKILRVVWIVVRLILILGLLYCFVCSLDVLQDAFQLLGGRAAGSIFTNSVLVSNPVAGLMIGVLVTVLVQSSSTSTSIVVSMVGSGLLEVKPAIPIIMGANIGTTVTNTLVALTQSTDRATFRRAFAGATVHDAFNWLTVLILLPLEVATGYLYYMTRAMVSGITHSEDSDNPQFLKVITDPFTNLIVDIDKKVIDAIAQETDRQKFPLAKYWCKEVKENFVANITSNNDTLVQQKHNEIFSYNVQVGNDSLGNSILYWTEILQDNSTKCTHLFVGTGMPGALSEAAGGVILLIGSLLALIICLILMVKILNSLLRGSMASLVRKTINADFPGKLAFLTGYVALLVGAGVTVLVQSSSVFTSALTPLVGIGVVTLERVYPLTLGSNIGTTITSILAALTADANMIQYTMQISLCHLFFNITGILIFFPIPFMRRIPINIAKMLGNTTAKYRWFAIFYLIMMFLALPMAVFGLSMAGLWVLVGVGVPILVLLAFVVVVNILQKKKPHWLHPKALRSWDWLPKPLHSLQPYDRIVTSFCCCYVNSPCYKCKCCKNDNAVNDDVEKVSHRSSTEGTISTRSPRPEAAEEATCVNIESRTISSSENTNDENVIEASRM